MNYSSSNSSDSSDESSDSDDSFMDQDIEFIKTDEQVRLRRALEIITRITGTKDTKEDFEKRGDGSGERRDSNDFVVDKDYEFIKDHEKLGLLRTLLKMSRLPDDKMKEAFEALKKLIRIEYGVENEPFENADLVEPFESRERREKKPLLLWQVWKQEDKKFVDEHLTERFDSDFFAETADTPSDLVKPLMEHQKEWLGWAMKQEEGPARGGIVADQMGMGKTIQAIALVLAKCELNQKTRGADIPSLASTSSTDLPGIKATLVVCPVVAVSRWVNNIDEFTTKGSMKVLVYHGANRGKNSKQFSDFDFVITTYSTVEAEYGDFTMPAREKCPYCRSSFVPEGLNAHLKYFCGPDAQRTEKQSKKQRKTMKTMPSTSKQKMDYDKDKKDFQLKKTKKHGLDGVDFEENFELPKAKTIFLHSVNWNRIILDEAHCVKDACCYTAKAIFALESSYKWALTGTPIQNRMEEFYSLVRFLQIVPYSYYLCKDCDCRILDYSLFWRIPKQCSSCPHSFARHFCWFNKYITMPIISPGNSDDRKRAIILLKQKVLENISFSRTKYFRAAETALPPRIVTIRRDALDGKEEYYYKSLYQDSRAQFHKYVTAGTVSDKYAQLFELFTRLRQVVDHPYLVVHSKTAALRNGNMLHSAQAEQVCGICHDPAEDPEVTSCAHATCSQRLTVDLSSNANSGDQTFKNITKGFKSSRILNRIQLNDFQTSTKIEALREEITFMVERDGSAKGVVFSQFTSFLDLISYSLQRSGVNCVQLDGSMTLAARDAAIKKFTDDPDCKIFLTSLKSGGVALNLTVASHVFMMDPLWNITVEKQALARIHGIGQYKPVRIVIFVIENTIEERIMLLRELKSDPLYQGPVDGYYTSGMLTIPDWVLLFDTC